MRDATLHTLSHVACHYTLNSRGVLADPLGVGASGSTWSSRAFKTAVAAVLASCATLGVVLFAALVLPTSSHSIAGGPPYTQGDAMDVLAIAARNIGVALLFFALARLLTQRARGAWVRRGVGVVLLLVVVAQAAQQGVALSAVAAYLGVPVARLWLTVLPHAVLELAAIALPTIALLVFRDVPGALPRWEIARSAFAVAVPLLLIAALLETYASPRAYSATLCTSVEPEVTAQGGCKPCPPWAEAEFRRHLQSHAPLSARAGVAIDGGCTWSSNTVPAGYAQPAPGQLAASTSGHDRSAER